MTAAPVSGEPLTGLEGALRREWLDVARGEIEALLRLPSGAPREAALLTLLSETRGNRHHLAALRDWAFGYLAIAPFMLPPDEPAPAARAEVAA